MSNPTNSSDIILSASPAYQTSWFGKYYLPPDSPLINAGSTTADQVGLYHFTTQTDQMPETNSVVDIGYHYVATDAYGNPLDSNGNGTPDYLEDVCGCGQPMSIQWISPANTSAYAEPANIPLQVSVFDWSSPVTNVSFLAGATQITATTNSPFLFTWPVVSSGAYGLSASAWDAAGKMVSTTNISVTVTNMCGN